MTVFAMLDLEGKETLVMILMNVPKVQTVRLILFALILSGHMIVFVIRDILRTVPLEGLVTVLTLMNVNQMFHHVQLMLNVLIHQAISVVVACQAMGAMDI